MKEKKILIEARILSDSDFRMKCLMLLYDKQTEDEQATGGVFHKNNRGFNASDSFFLSTIALLKKQEQDEGFRYTNYIPGSSMQKLLAKLLSKYSNQLCNYLTEDEILN